MRDVNEQYTWPQMNERSKRIGDLDGGWVAVTFVGCSGELPPCVGLWGGQGDPLLEGFGLIFQ
jgi:hypothetical protein